MDAILNELLASMIKGVFTLFDTELLLILDRVLHFETMLSTVFSQAMITALYNEIYSFSIALLVLKFLFKGFQIYILWRDGDADCSPQDMLVGAGEAVFVMTCFPVLYEAMSSITLSLSKLILKNLQLSDSLNFAAGNVPNAFGLVENIVLIVYLVMLVILYIKMLEHGAGLLVMRMAVPVMTLGLIDSDSGNFKPFMQKLYKTMFTCIIQMAMFSLSLRVAVDFTISNLIVAIVLVGAAFATPIMLQEWTVQTRQHAPAGTKVYQGAQLARTVTAFFK